MNIPCIMSLSVGAEKSVYYAFGLNLLKWKAARVKFYVSGAFGKDKIVPLESFSRPYILLRQKKIYTFSQTPTS